MLHTFQRKTSRKFLTKICGFSTAQPPLSNEKLRKIKEFRKITNLSIGICKSILNKNDYNIEKSVNYIFINFKENYEKKEKKLVEGYYCLISRDSFVGITELNSYNDLISENINFKELLINLCNSLRDDNIRVNTSYSNLEKKRISHYIHLFYKNSKINIDKSLENVEDTNAFKQIYFNRTIKQLIDYTSYILNDYIFLRKYLSLNLDNLCFDRTNVYMVKKGYYHKEVKIDDFILCKGFSFAFVSVQFKDNITEQTKLIIEKLASLVCINVLIYQPKRCSNSLHLDIRNCFQQSFFNSSINNLKFGKKEKKSKEITDKTHEMLWSKENSQHTQKVNAEQGDDDDFMLKKVESFYILGDYFEKSNHTKLKGISKDDLTFVELITALEEELKIKIYTNIMYAMLNEDMVIL
ncbi:conserved Plasmodium protein, unknown function [Plasmodium ovale]|uniref:Uncharacterized protein n=2 Tax=Plasmodium ovale TaxID=36330 RepID=A0A1A8WW39_PLAOA|nr:conserved Plasmodium protein, unknown function [Plasmodium ovale curtisi]SCP05853.1 conserved Plasmodium protein, unknown function [Plasmodium ovale]